MYCSKTQGGARTHDKERANTDHQPAQQTAARPPSSHSGTRNTARSGTAPEPQREPRHRHSTSATAAHAAPARARPHGRVEDSAALKHSACGSTPSTLQVVEPPGVLGAATQPEKGRPAALSHEAAERYTHLGLRIAQCQPCKPALTHKHALGPTEGATPHTPRPKRGVVGIVEEGESPTP